MSESTTGPAGRARRARPQAVLTVLHRERIAPHTVRITAGGPGFGALRLNDFTDKYAKIIFADPGLGLTPPYDLAALRDSLPPGRQPVTRTYTLRRADERRQQVDIDFVVHGDKGIAAPWAARTEPGEYLDATPPSGVQVTWLHRPHPGSEPRLLADALLAGPWPVGRAGVFAHGERESMKAVRAALKDRLGDGDKVSLSGYWAAGRSEEVFQSEKRQPIGQV